FFHEFLGKGLAAFYNSRFAVRSESLHSRLAQRVYGSQHKRIVGSDYREIYFIFSGKAGNAFNVFGADIHACGVGGNAPVAGQSEYLAHRRIFLYFFDDGVLSASAAYYHYLHRYLRLISHQWWKSLMPVI